MHKSSLPMRPVSKRRELSYNVMLLLSTLEKGILEDQGGQQYLRKCLSLQTRQRGSHLKKKPQ